MTTLQTVPTSFVSVNGLKIAYRRFGASSPLPLVYVNHLRGSMDTLDPLLFNTIAKSREVIVYDSAGIGHSEGTVPDSIPEMAAIVVNLLTALEIPKADFIGFSMGGGIVQHIGYEYPQIVNKLVLAGTQPGIGEGVALPPREVLESAGANNDQPPTEDDMMNLFFYPSETSLALGHAWWKRIHERNVEGEPRKAYLTGTGAQAQLAAIFKFTTDTSNFERLADIKAPVLVTNGHTDIMSPTSNSFVLQQNIANAHLHLYPDAGHGHLFQVPELYAKELELFLNN
ncbi:Putative Hydrolase [Penicillium brasilianum]|uniref:Putative Hydrolase n=1 Tax=Penicillium brasilianum TaxID=104259 RepID=A0A0F7TH35_PENBI|nr:Putative Hydrolase [Penicillium brasilianum]